MWNKTHGWYYPESLGFTHNEWWNTVRLCGVCGLSSWRSVLSNVCPTYSIHATRLRRYSRLIDQDWLSSVWPEQVSFWLWPHFWSCLMQVKSKEERLLSPHSWQEAGNLNCLFKFFFHSALREIELDPLLLEQVRLGGFVCLEKKHWNWATVCPHSLPALPLRRLRVRHTPRTEQCCRARVCYQSFPSGGMDPNPGQQSSTSLRFDPLSCQLCLQYELRTPHALLRPAATSSPCCTPRALPRCCCPRSLSWPSAENCCSCLRANYLWINRQVKLKISLVCVRAVSAWHDSQEAGDVSAVGRVQQLALCLCSRALGDTTQTPFESIRL